MNPKLIGITIAAVLIIGVLVVFGLNFLSNNNLLSFMSISSQDSSRVTNCTFSNLNAVASWQGGAGSMAGGVQFTNKGAQDCAIDLGGLTIQVEDNTDHQVLQTKENNANPAEATTVIKAKQNTFVPLVWTNWCKDNPLHPLSLDITLSDGSQMTVPLTGLGGVPVSDTPRCDNSVNPSVLSIKPPQQH